MLECRVQLRGKPRRKAKYGPPPPISETTRAFLATAFQIHAESNRFMAAQSLKLEKAYPNIPVGTVIQVPHVGV